MSDLNRDDIFLLLKSYENTVKSNQTLLEQQKRLLENHQKIIDKQAEVINVTKEILNKAEEINSNLCVHSKSCAEKSESIEQRIGDSTLENIKSHSNLKVKIIVTTAIVGSVVVGLIALVERIWTKSNQIIILLEIISKQLGVTP